MQGMTGRALGRYRLDRLLGAGGMGEVYVAHDTATGRPVAVKLLAGVRNHPELVERLRNEARIQARLYHPNIATLLELFETSLGPCLVMEYVGGPALAEALARLPADDWRSKLRLVAEIARGVGYLHARGIVHRDIKPDNIRLDENGTPRLLDFGIARDGASPGLTMAGNVVGTLQYMAPETLETGRADTRSDVWALGIMLHEVLSGRLPYQFASLGELLGQIRKGGMRPAEGAMRHMPPGVERLIGACLESNPKRRPADAGVVAAALDDLTGAAGTHAPSAKSAPRRALAESMTLMRRPLLRGGMAVAVGLVVVVAALMLVQRDASAPVEQAADPVAALDQQQPSFGGSGTSISAHAPEPIVTPALSPFGSATDEAAETYRVVVEGHSGKYEVWRDGRLLGSTPLAIAEPFGTRMRLECRRDQRVVDVLEFDVGLRNVYPCKN